MLVSTTVQTDAKSSVTASASLATYDAFATFVVIVTSTITAYTSIAIVVPV